MQVVSLRDTVPLGTRGTEWARRAFSHLELGEEEKSEFVSQVVGVEDQPMKRVCDGSPRHFSAVPPLSNSRSQKLPQFSKASLSSSSSSRFGLGHSSSEPLIVPPPRWPSS